MKLIVGFLTAKPAKREAFLAAARHHLEETRKGARLPLFRRCLALTIGPTGDC